MSNGSANVSGIIDTAKQRIDRPVVLDIDHIKDFTIPAKGKKDHIDIKTLANVHGVLLYWEASSTAATAAEMKTDVGQIAVYVGGQLIAYLTATEIIDLYDYFNEKNAALGDHGVLPIMFTPFMIPLAERNRGYALGMLADGDLNRQNNFRVEVTMLSPASLTVDSCEVHLLTDRYPPSTIGTHVRWKHARDTFATASAQKIHDLEWDANCRGLYGIHVTEAQAVNKVSWKFNGINRINEQPKGLRDYQQYAAGRTPQSGYTHIDWSLQNDPRSYEPVVGHINHELELTWGTGPNDYDYHLHELCENLT